VSLLGEALLGRAELEGPQEVVGLLEVGADGGNLVDEILNGGNTVLAELTLNNGVVSKRNARSSDLAMASLVDKLSNDALRGVAVGHVGLDSSDHVHGGLVESHEHSVVELSESEELQDLLAGGVKLVDTTKKGASQNRVLYQIAKDSCAVDCAGSLLINKENRSRAETLKRLTLWF
jgi:hypothetical protein